MGSWFGRVLAPVGPGRSPAEPHHARHLHPPTSSPRDNALRQPFPARDLKPILRNVKGVANSRLTIEAADLEYSVQVEVANAAVEAPGKTLLPTERFHAILREAVDRDLTLEAGEETCAVRGAAAEFELGGSDPAEFPSFPAGPTDC